MPRYLILECQDIWYLSAPRYLIFECQAHHCSLKPSHEFLYRLKMWNIWLCNKIVLLGWAIETRIKRQLSLDHPGTSKQFYSSNVKRLMKHCVCILQRKRHKTQSKKTTRVDFAVANLLERVQQDGHTERRERDRVLLWVFSFSKMISRAGFDITCRGREGVTEYHEFVTFQALPLISS